MARPGAAFIDRQDLSYLLLFLVKPFWRVFRGRGVGYCLRVLRDARCARGGPRSRRRRCDRRRPHAMRSREVGM